MNCLLFPYLNDAVKLLESGAATIDEIDAAIKEQAGFPMGPFALLDVVGNDVSLAIQKSSSPSSASPASRPPPRSRGRRRGPARSQDRRGLPRLH